MTSATTRVIEKVEPFYPYRKYTIWAEQSGNLVTTHDSRYDTPTTYEHSTVDSADAAMDRINTNWGRDAPLTHPANLV